MFPPVLISGSLAYDLIMDYPDSFRDQIIGGTSDLLNLVFMVPHLRREFGGCAGNIAYNLHALGGNALMLASVGHDFAPYAERLRALNINQQGLFHCPDQFTAQAFIINDLHQNQIIAFHPGAMNFAHRVATPASINPQWGIVAPNGKEAMITHMREWRKKNIKVIFDPGQGLPMFSGEELRALIPQAQALIVNEYEAELLQEKTGWDQNQIAHAIHPSGILIVTLGEKGVRFWQDGIAEHLGAMTPDQVTDPTGCGDALRAGLLYGLSKNWHWHRCLRLGNIIAGIKVAYPGPQNHPLDWQNIRLRYQQTYQESLPD